MLYELRHYRCTPGKLGALLKRFEVATLDLFAKHAIRPVGFWTTLIGESNQDLMYMLAWESLAQRESKWGQFVADPQLHALFAQTEKDGVLVAAISNQILKPTSFSALQ